MSKKKVNTNANAKISLVVGTTPERYKLYDTRLMKPICHQEYKNGILSGSMLIQNLDTVSLNKKKKLTYFVPNNIALLLSVSKKSLDTAKLTYNKNFLNPEFELDINNISGDKKLAMNNVSSLVCDYLESIQTSIVFGYTALEAFINLSIPDDYIYTAEKSNKGIIESYDKKAIERWLPLKTKLDSVLTEVYQTKKVQNEKWWTLLLDLENYRNDIIHQKSISHTEFYKDYFKERIFKVCQSVDTIIQFFHDAHANENKTNPIWPWTEGTSTLPINLSYNSSNFEVIGNMYEGIKKKL